MLAFDDAVQRALIVGDYKGAVAQCISANKMADVLVIANVWWCILMGEHMGSCLVIINNVFIMSLSYMVVSFSGCFCNGEQWSVEPCKYKAPQIPHLRHLLFSVV